MNWQEAWDIKVAEVEAAELKAGDVIEYTNYVQQRMGTTRSRTYFMEIVGMDSHVATGINTKTGKPAKVYLAQAITWKVLSRKVAA